MTVLSTVSGPETPPLDLAPRLASANIDDFTVPMGREEEWRFAPVNDQAQAAAAAVDKFKGSLDLHSGAAWENVFILKQIIEDEKVMAKPDTLKADREKIRAGLAKLTATDGLLGKSKRTPDREAVKPYLFVHAKAGKWVVLHTPAIN